MNSELSVYQRIRSHAHYPPNLTISNDAPNPQLTLAWVARDFQPQPTMNPPWPQPLDPLHSVALSALAASLPLVVVLILMGALRKSGLFASLCGFLSVVLLALFLWQMPAILVLWSAIYGVVYALWPILWIVFTALWLYNLTQDTGKFELLRRWMEQHATSDSSIQAVLVAFCFGALLEGTAGFGAPVAVTACLLVGLGHPARRAVLVALIANTAPVAFGALGIPTIGLAGVTGLDLAKLSAMTGRQVPFLSLLLPAYLICVVSGAKGLRKNWPVALVSGLSFALTQFLVSNFWGPYITDVLAASISIFATVAFLKLRSPANAETNLSNTPPGNRPPEAPPTPLTAAESFAAWLPWVMLSMVVILWSWLRLMPISQAILPVPCPAQRRSHHPLSKALRRALHLPAARPRHRRARSHYSHRALPTRTQQDILRLRRKNLPPVAHPRGDGDGHRRARLSL